MPEGEDDRGTYEAVCPQCGEEQTIMRTVPWQHDTCLECGATVDDGE